MPQYMYSLPLKSMPTYVLTTIHSLSHSMHASIQLLVYISVFTAYPSLYPMVLTVHLQLTNDDMPALYMLTWIYIIVQSCIIDMLHVASRSSHSLDDSLGFVLLKTNIPGCNEASAQPGITQRVNLSTFVFRPDALHNTSCIILQTCRAD